MGGLQLTAVSPNKIAAGSGAFTITVTGVGFLNGAIVLWNGSPLTTTFVNATTLAAAVRANLVAQSGAASVTVKNPAGAASNALPFTVTGAGPSIVSLLPSVAKIGAPDTVIHLTGASFVSGAQVLVNGAPVNASFESSTQISGLVPASFFAKAATLTIAVKNPDGALSNQASLTVVAALPSITFSPPSNPGPANQPEVTLVVNQPYTTDLSGTLTLTFVPDQGSIVDDPAIQFVSGGRSIDFTVPANTTTVPKIQVQTGTVAGTITITLKLSAGGADLSPNPNVATIIIPRSAPVIRSASLVRNGSSVTVTIVGYSTTREMTTGVFHFAAASGAVINTPDITVQLGSLFANWYSSAQSAQYGSLFTYTQTFTMQTGDAASIGSVTVSLANSVGATTSSQLN